MNAEAKIKCPECGMSVPDVPEDAGYEATLCNACYEALEEEKNQEKAISKADALYDAMKEGCLFPGCRAKREYRGHTHPTGKPNELLLPAEKEEE